MDESTHPDTAVPPTPRRSAWRLAAWLLGGLLAVSMLLLIGVGGVAWWAARSETGSAWLLSHIPGVQAAGTRGALLGDFSAQRLSVRLPGNPESITVTGLGWAGVTLQRGSGTRWLFIGIDDLHADRLDIVLAPATKSAPMTAPSDLGLPVEVDLRSLRIGELHMAALGEQPVRDLRARLHLGAAAGEEHRIDGLSLTWDRLVVSATGHIATHGPMTLQAALKLEQLAAGPLPAWATTATLAGPLAAPTLQATVRAQPSPDRPAQSLDASVTLRPFAAWPLGELQATVQALDLSAFSSAMPATTLSGRAVATSSALNQPASIKLTLANASAGRWDAHRLPLRSLSVELAARPDDPSTLDVHALDADLGSERSSAGHVTGQGHWTAARWTLDAALEDVQPSLLDARAAPMRVNGPVALAGSGDMVEIRSTLNGQLAERGPAREVQLSLDASLSALRIDLRSMQARAGTTRATLAGRVSRENDQAPWAAKGSAALIDFDPAAWWPGPEDSPWRKAPTKLNAKASFDLLVPPDIGERPASTIPTALRGQADVTLASSVLVGVPISGEIKLQNSGGAQAIPTIRLDADGNHLQAEGRLATGGSGAADHWDLAIDGPALSRLAPVFKLFTGAGADATLTGSLTAKARIDGRWPVLTSQGELEAQGLRVGAAAVQHAQAQWRLGSSADAPVDAQVTLTDAALMQAGGPGPSLESLRLQLKGTGRAHSIDLHAESKVLPPAWTDVLQPGSGMAPSPAAPASPSPAASGAATVPHRTVATVRAQGSFVDLPSAAWAGWRGKIQQIDVRSSTAGAAPLLQTRDVALDAFWSGGPSRVVVQPGRAEMLGGAVRWSRIAWSAATEPGGFAQIEAQADVEPLKIAPLLARAQPDFGWGGDLTISGHLTLRSAPGFHADIVVERTAGDLTVTDELSTQALGITDLRLALNADNGVWNFTQALAGKMVGVAAGAVVARTSPQATWPSPDTPLEGVIELDVANLGTWGTWVPPGWRLDGALHTSASIGGRFGAPEYTGQIKGTKLAVRNFLQGVNVNVSDGDVSISLRGDTAHIERFNAKAGLGTLQIEGNAVLGSQPKADLKLTAEKFQLLGRVDRRIVTSGQARLQLDSKTLALDGKFNVDEGLIDFSRSDAPTLSDDVDVVRAKGVVSPAAAAASSAAPATAPPPGRNVALDLNVTLGEKLRVRGHGLDAGLRGELKITSPGGRLAVDGSISTADGTYQAYGQKLSIDRGVITFNGPVDNPRLDIEATRPNLDVRVGVAVSGPTSNPRVRLFSEPDMSDIDKLSWLVMGRASDGLGRTDTALLQRAALALLSGEGPGVTDRLIKSIGLDDISVSQSEGDVHDTVISLGKQISRRWYVGYERGLNATAGSWQLIYRIAQRFTLRAQAGGESSLDLIWTWRWQ